MPANQQAPGEGVPKLFGRDEPLTELLARWSRERSGRVSEYTVTFTRQTVDSVWSASGWRALPDAKRDDIVVWLADLLDEGSSGKTHNNRLSALRRFFEWCVKSGRMTYSPAQGIEPVTHHAEAGMRAFTLEEMRAIIRGARERHDAQDRRHSLYRRSAYILAATTGLRKGEQYALRWAMLQGDQLELPGSITKAGAPQTVMLPPEAITTLEDLRGSTGPGPRDFVFSRRVDNRQLFDDMEAVGVPRYDARGRPAGWHSWRKGFITVRALNGDSVWTLKQAARHSDIRTTLKSYLDAGQLPLKKSAADYPLLAVDNSVDAAGRDESNLTKSDPVADDGSARSTMLMNNVTSKQSHETPGSGPGGSVSQPHPAEPGVPAGRSRQGKDALSSPSSSELTPAGFEPALPG